MPETIGVHPYQRSPHSGAGNCTCGRAERDRLHPHEYAQSWWDEQCTCGHLAGSMIHTDRLTAVVIPRSASMTRLDAVAAAVRAARGGDAPAGIRGYA